MSSYSHTTWLQLRQQLAARLSDPSNTFWADAELQLWTVEALRCWGAHSTYWRDRGVFNSVASQGFYDLTATLPALLGYTVTDQTLVQQIQYHLMEPANATAWTGSEQFTYAEIAAAIQRRRDQFLSMRRRLRVAASSWQTT